MQSSSQPSAQRISPGAWCALALAVAATSCRSPEGTPDAPKDTGDQPFVADQPPTEAEAARNSRFEDMRRTRFNGAEPLRASIPPAGDAKPDDQ